MMVPFLIRVYDKFFHSAYWPTLVPNTRMHTCESRMFVTSYNASKTGYICEIRKLELDFRKGF